MESLPRLRSILLTTLEPQNNIDEQELFDLLVLHRRNLVNLYLSPPSDDERRELQSGTYPFIPGSQTWLMPFTHKANALWTVNNCPSTMTLQPRLSTSPASSPARSVTSPDSCNMSSRTTPILALSTSWRKLSLNTTEDDAIWPTLSDSFSRQQRWPVLRVLPLSMVA